MRFITLKQATRRYKLREPSITNTEIAVKLHLRAGIGDYQGSPECIFKDADGNIQAIRIDTDVIVIFHLFQMTQGRMEKIADRITGEESEETHP